jgi:flagellar secretion chaperone FliS
MFMSSRGYARGAVRQYSAIHAGSQIEGATPHQLIKILFDELLNSIDAAALAEKQGYRATASDKQTRALTILHALETSLDFKRGGEIAVGLSQIYREARRRILTGSQMRSPEKIADAGTIIREISDAWTAIG